VSNASRSDVSVNHATQVSEKAVFAASSGGSLNGGLVWTGGLIVVSTISVRPP
jgi:hypothetical protein